jgi:carbon starvation protein
VRDPLGGINSLWPLFGIANQMLAAIALCLAVTIILKMQLAPAARSDAQNPKSKVGRPALALIAFVPLLWLLSVTMTAGVQKIWSPNPKIGFLAQAASLKEHEMTGVKMVQDAGELLRKSRVQQFNNRLDAVVAATFLVLISAIFLMSLREWILLLARRKAADLHETPPTWLPDYMLAQAKPWSAVALLALAFALLKELSGEADLDRARHAHDCACAQKSDAQIFSEVTEERFQGVRRCC